MNQCQSGDGECRAGRLGDRKEKLNNGQDVRDGGEIVFWLDSVLAESLNVEYRMSHFECRKWV